MRLCDYATAQGIISREQGIHAADRKEQGVWRPQISAALSVTSCTGLPVHREDCLKPLSLSVTAAA